MNLPGCASLSARAGRQHRTACSSAGVFGLGKHALHRGALYFQWDWVRRGCDEAPVRPAVCGSALGRSAADGVNSGAGRGYASSEADGGDREHGPCYVRPCSRDS